MSLPFINRISYYLHLLYSIFIFYYSHLLFSLYLIIFNILYYHYFQSSFIIIIFNYPYPLSPLYLIIFHPLSSLFNFIIFIIHHHSLTSSSFYHQHPLSISFIILILLISSSFIILIFLIILILYHPYPVSSSFFTIIILYHPHPLSSSSFIIFIILVILPMLIIPIININTPRPESNPGPFPPAFSGEPRAPNNVGTIPGTISPMRRQFLENCPKWRNKNFRNFLQNVVSIKVFFLKTFRNFIGPCSKIPYILNKMGSSN